MPYTPFWILHLENFGTIISEYLGTEWSLAYVSGVFFSFLFALPDVQREHALDPKSGLLTTVRLNALQCDSDEADVDTMEEIGLYDISQPA